MLEAMSKSVFHSLAASDGLKAMASRYGMRSASGFARRFVAGETAEEAIDAARAIESRGLTQTLDLLGESVDSAAAAHAAARAYLSLMESIAAAGIGRNISLKLTQLGLDVDRAACEDHLRRILDAAASGGFFVRVDMENSPYTAATLDIVEAAWQRGQRNVGVVLQTCLKRTEADLARMVRLGVRIRLVKGAYKEPASVAYQQKADVDEAYRRMIRTLLAEGTYPAFATHDEGMIQVVKSEAAARHVPPAQYEFQMLYGIRRDLQAALVREGYNVRIYVPFGREWFPYFMRRLGERPANVFFVMKGLVRDR